MQMYIGRRGELREHLGERSIALGSLQVVVAADAARSALKQDGWDAQLAADEHLRDGDTVSLLHLC